MKIKIEVEFDKSLPFKEELYINESPLFFEKKEICSFSPKKAWCNLLYYEDDFAISISTKNDEDEIVLIKGNFENNFNLQNEIISVLSKKKDNDVRINREDTIIVPIIEVDNSSDFSDLLPVQLYTEKYPFIIEELKQKINFTLNNNGAEIKSRLFMRGAVQCILNEPKILEFNKPFIVTLKKVDNNEPYFAMYISNADYLKKYSKKYIEKINKEISDNRPIIRMF